jgi:hypothetical protein
MNETVDTATEWFLGGWNSPETDGDETQDRLNEYIIGPDPLPDNRYDDGGCD